MNIAIKGGGRNRASRRRRAERKARRYPGPVETWLHRVAEPVFDLSGPWTPEVAEVALREYKGSGLSQRAFAKEKGFPVGRLNTWRKRLDAATNP